jgi:hypothetical protein
MKTWIKISVFCLVISILSSLNCLKKSDIPIVVTAVSQIKATSAVLGGQVIDDGGAKVDVVGICFGTSSDPDKLNSVAYYRKGVSGPFIFTVPVLAPSTIYHVRAFATNYVGTAYGDEIDFKTLLVIKPEVTTMLDASSISYCSAEAGGLVKSDDDTPVFDIGIYISTKPNSTSFDRMISCGSGTGYFTGMRWDLKPETIYYIRAYARYRDGVICGEDIQIKTRNFPFITLPVDTIESTTCKVAGKYILEDFPADYFWWVYSWNEGICYGTSPFPTIKDTFIVANSIQSDIIFVCMLKNLSPGTIYYARAYRHFIPDLPNFPTYDEYANQVSFTTAH